MNAIPKISPESGIVSIRRESFSQLRADIEPLLKEHWKEVAHHKNEIHLDPDYERYQQGEALGNAVMIAARIDGRLIGYSIFALYWHIHYKNCRVAANDVLYLIPEYRKTGTGIRLIKESERELKKVGVNFITWHIKPEHDFSILLKRMGYIHEEIIMGKVMEN